MCDPLQELQNAASAIATPFREATSQIYDAAGVAAEQVGGVVKDTLAAIADDPLKAIAKVAAISAGQWQLIPLIDGAAAVAHGKDIGEVVKTMATSYVAQEVAIGVGTAAGQAAGEAFGKTAGQIIGAGSGAAAAAVVTGDDPLKAFLTGGISAAVPAVLGKIDGFTTLQKDYPNVAKTLQNVVATKLANGDVNAALINGLVTASGIVGKSLAAYEDATGTKLTAEQAAVAGNALFATTTAALQGKEAGAALSASLTAAGTKALSKMITSEFKSAVGNVAAENTAAKAAGTKLQDNQLAQEAAIADHNNIRAQFAIRSDEQTRLIGVDTAARAELARLQSTGASIATQNAQVAVVNASTFAANAYGAALAKDYNETYKPVLDAKAAELASLQGKQPAIEQTYTDAVDRLSKTAAPIQTAIDTAEKVASQEITAPIDTEFGDYQGALDKQAASLPEKVSFSQAYEAARASYGPGQEFTWTNPKTGATDRYTTQSLTELKAQEVADQKRIDLMPVYGGAQNTRTGKPLGAEDIVYIDTKTGDVVTDDRVWDAAGNVVSGSLNLAGEGTVTAALNTAVGSAIRTGLDVGAGLIKGGGNLLEQVGTVAGLLGADINNPVRVAGKSVSQAVSDMRSTEFKDDQKLMNKAIAAAGGEGFFAQAVETFKQFGASPIQTAAFIAEQGTSLLVGGGAMTAARALGAGLTVAEAAALTVNAVTQGASVASETYDALIKQGKSPEEALASSRAAAALATLTSAVANKFIPGAMSAEGMVAAQTAAKTTLVNALKGEMTSELAEEASGKVIQNLLTGQAWNTDLGTTAVQALLGSGLTTGAVHTAYSALDPVKATPTTGLENVTATQYAQATKAFADTGYTPTANEVAQLVAPDAAEAQQMMRDLGYTNMTDAEAQSLAGKITTAEAQKAVEAYVNPRQVTEAEARQTLTDLGYTNPTAAEISQFVRSGANVDQAAVQAEAAAYTDPRVTDKGEVEAAYAALGLTKPTAADVAKLVGVYSESELGGKAAAGLDSARYNSIISQLDTLTAGNSKETIDAINLVKADLNKQLADLGVDISGVKTDVAGVKTDVAGVKTEVAALETKLTDAIAVNEAAGMTRDAATQKAIADVSTALGTTKADLLTQLGTTETALTEKLAAVETAVGTKVAALETKLTDAIAVNEAAGMTRDAATQKAIADVSTALGTTKADLLTQLGTTETALTEKLAAVETAVGTKVAALETKLTDAIAVNEAAGMTRDAATQKAIADVSTALGTTKADLLTQLGTTETALTEKLAAVETAVGTKVAALETKLTDAIAVNEAAGMTRDAATQKAIADVSTALGTTKADLLTQLGTTETALTEKLAAVESALTGQITDATATMNARVDELVAQGKTQAEATQQAFNEVNKLIGTQATPVTQKDLDILQGQMQGTQQIDTKFDANKDGVVNQADYDFLQNVVRGVNTQPFQWEPTGLYGQLAASEAARKEDARKATELAAATAAAQQAQAAANLKTVQQGQIRGQMQTGIQGLMSGLQQQAQQQAATLNQPVEVVQAGPQFDISQPLDVGFFGGYAQRKATNTTQAPQGTVKIASGGYLDDLLDAIR